MRLLISSSLLFLSITAISQGKLSDRIFFGGGFGLSAGSNTTNISLSPQVGYKITERFMSGVGVIYQYVRFGNIDTSISNFGWSVFSRYAVTRQFFAYSEFERLRYEFFTSVSPELATERDNYNSLLIGAGYNENLGGRASFSFMALYNVLYDASEFPQPYNSPWVIRAGVGVGL